MHHLKTKTVHHWEEAGIAVGVLLIVVNWFAVATPWLSGPLFHPVWMILGALAIYVSGMFLAGAGQDQLDHS